MLRTNASPDDDRVLTLPQGAQIVGVSADTLRRLNKAGKLKIVRLSERRVGVRLSELRRFIAARES